MKESEKSFVVVEHFDNNNGYDSFRPVGVCHSMAKAKVVISELIAAHRAYTAETDPGAKISEIKGKSGEVSGLVIESETAYWSEVEFRWMVAEVAVFTAD